MALNHRALSRVTSSERGPRKRASLYVYSTDDDAAAVQAEGYFSAAAERHRLRVGDWIEATVSLSGTPAKIGLLISAIVNGVVSVVLGIVTPPAIVMPATILVDGLDSLNDVAGTARTAQGSASNAVLNLDNTRHKQSSGGIRVSQTAAANATIGINSANVGNYTPNGDDVFAFYIDILDNALTSQQQLNLIRGANTASFPQSDTAFKGGDWVACTVSEMASSAAFIAAGAGVLGTSLRVSQNSPYGADVVFDALVRGRGIPMYTFRYDDISISQYEVALPLHQKYNIPMSCNVAVDLVGNGTGRWSQAQMDAAYATGLVEFNSDSTRGDTSANIADTDADRAAALTSLMANHDYLVSKGYTKDNGHKHLIWANGTMSDRLAQHFMDNGFRTMLSVLAGINFVKFGIGRGRAKKVNSHPSVGTETFDADWKPKLLRAKALGGWHIQHCHGVSDSGNDTRPAELEKKLAWVRAEVDAGLGLAPTIGQAWNRFGGYTPALSLS